MTPDTDEQTAREAAGAWLEGAKGVPELSRRCGYEHEAAIYGWLAGYHAGRAAGLEAAAGICNERETRFDKRATKEAESDNDLASDYYWEMAHQCGCCAEAIRAAASTYKRGDITPKGGGR